MGINTGIDVPVAPDDTKYLYDVFCQLKGITRSKLTLFDIDFYIKSSGLDLQQWEVKAIMNIDSIFQSKGLG